MLLYKRIKGGIKVWLEKEKLLELISQLEPNYNIQRLSQRSSKELFRIYEYLLKNVKLQPKKATRKKVVAIEECEVVYEREEFLSQDEIDLMYPDGGGPMTNSGTRLVNLDEGDGFKHRM